jgi:hypothetical protein
MKRALVTGASEGIGREFAKSLAEQGFAVTCVARNEKRLLELMGVLQGQEHAHLVADLTRSEDIQELKKLIENQKFDLLINNAGMATYGSFANVEYAQITRMMDLNCQSVLELSHAFLRTAKSGDALINVSSTASFLPMPITSAYTASKAFVTSLSESLWFEERRKGVYVMALCPGMTQTNFHSRAGGQDEQMPAWFSQKPEQVVQKALRALKRRNDPVVICGPQAPLIFLAKFIPRKWVIMLAGKTLEWGLGH